MQSQSAEVHKNSDSESLSTAGSISTEEGDHAELSFGPLDHSAITRFVQSDQAGAIAIFLGTTRDSFGGRKVTRLEYEAYTPLALKTLSNLMKQARLLGAEPLGSQTTSLIRCAIHHRLGNVPVGETSIVIAVSSPHRRAAFKACEWLLEEVKLKAQIWKREWYEGESPSEAKWKENFPPATSHNPRNDNLELK
ncbi:Molybdopterin synthase catalytic subunit [Tulasnella sp. 418]|nr:Molybdopterin synthase catalytic subunit [Tulasnella sp. 418]